MGHSQNLGLMVVRLVIPAGTWYYIYQLTWGREQNKKGPDDSKDIPDYKKV